MSKYDKWYIIGKLLCSTFRICKKIANLQKLNFFRKKPLTMPFKICKKYLQNFKITWFLIKEKLKRGKFPLTGCLQKNCNICRKTCAIHFFMSKAFQKAKFYQNLTSASGSKQRFSLLREKAVIQAVCLRTQAVVLKMGM